MAFEMLLEDGSATDVLASEAWLEVSAYLVSRISFTYSNRSETSINRRIYPSAAMNELTSVGGFSPRASARSHRSKRVTPTHGPNSYDLVKAASANIIHRKSQE